MQGKIFIQPKFVDSNNVYVIALLLIKHDLETSLLILMQIRPSICGDNARCRVDKNVPNLGYRCTCNEGYYMGAQNASNNDDISSNNYYENNKCVDVDECSIENGGCQHYCENSEGSFR